MLVFGAGAALMKVSRSANARAHRASCGML
jgi:hypothetical protein